MSQAEKELETKSPDYLATLMAEKFVSQFYAIFDSDRDQAENFFDPTSTINWDGNVFNGQDCKRHFASFPPSKHTVLSIDSQPVLVAPSGVAELIPPDKLLITVTGEVDFISRPVEGFHHTFFLLRNQQPPQLTYIMLWVFRSHPSYKCEIPKLQNPSWASSSDDHSAAPFGRGARLTRPGQVFSGGGPGGGGPGGGGFGGGRGYGGGGRARRG